MDDDYCLNILGIVARLAKKWRDRGSGLDKDYRTSFPVLQAYMGSFLG